MWDKGSLENGIIEIFSFTNGETDEFSFSFKFNPSNFLKRLSEVLILTRSISKYSSHLEFCLVLTRSSSELITA